MVRAVHRSSGSGRPMSDSSSKIMLLITGDEIKDTEKGKPYKSDDITNQGEHGIIKHYVLPNRHHTKYYCSCSSTGPI